MAVVAPTQAESTFYGGETPSAVDVGAFNLGQEFHVDDDGVIAYRARFYMTAAETGTHTARLYDAAGAVLASAVFAGEAEGWNEVAFPAPLLLVSGGSYRIAVNTNVEWPRKDALNPAVTVYAHTAATSAYFNDVDPAGYPDTPTGVTGNGYLRDIVLGVADTNGGGGGGTTGTYVTVEEFLRRVGVTNPSAAATATAQQCVESAAVEINSYLDWPRDPPVVLSSGDAALLAIVNTSRGAEHWRLTPYGTLNQGPDIQPVFAALDSFARYRRQLQPLKDMWGVA